MATKLSPSKLEDRVAELVMGWPSTPSSEGTHMYVCGGKYRLWLPLSDMSSAWSVVEKMRKLGFGIRISWQIIGADCHPDTTDMCQVWFSNEPNGTFYAEADTAPEAICRAALKAMEAKCI